MPINILAICENELWEVSRLIDKYKCMNSDKSILDPLYEKKSELESAIKNELYLHKKHAIQESCNHPILLQVGIDKDSYECRRYPVCICTVCDLVIDEERETYYASRCVIDSKVIANNNNLKIIFAIKSIYRSHYKDVKSIDKTEFTKKLEIKLEGRDL